VITRKIVILGTGGTLAGTAVDPSDNVGYASAQVGIDDLLARIPALRGTAIDTEQVAQVDSKDMTFGVWRELALRCADLLSRDDVSGVVITHGTDTIEETAYFLQQVLQPLKPIVLTCAMRPSTSLQADGPQNIVDSVAVASSPLARSVTVVCAGVVHGAQAVAKVHHYRLDAFSSGDTGPVAYVEDGRLRIVRDWTPDEPGQGALHLDAVAQVQAWPRVEIVMSYAGADGSLVRALVAHGVEGIVVAGTGNGTVHKSLSIALLEAQAAGVKVVRASRTAFGGVIRGPADLIASTNLAPVKARVALLIELLRSRAPRAPSQ
jgi:L-asparaginase